MSQQFRKKSLLENTSIKSTVPGCNYIVLTTRIKKRDLSSSKNSNCVYAAEKIYINKSTVPGCNYIVLSTRIKKEFFMLKTASASTQLRLKSPKKNRQKMYYIYTASKISKKYRTAR